MSETNTELALPKVEEEASSNQLALIIEGAILAAGFPLDVQAIEQLFLDNERPSRKQILATLEFLGEACQSRGYELKKTASGYRFQVREELSVWINRLWEEKPQKYSRALLETLSLIAYRQPATRGDIEEIRGVSVSSQIIKTLLEREWVRVVGHRDVPGRPALYATTKQFLDYFNMASLEELPALSDIRDIETLSKELGFSIEADAPKDEKELEQIESPVVDPSIELINPDNTTEQGPQND